MMLWPTDTRSSRFIAKALWVRLWNNSALFTVVLVLRHAVLLRLVGNFVQAAPTTRGHEERVLERK